MLFWVGCVLQLYIGSYAVPVVCRDSDTATTTGWSSKNFKCQMFI